MSFIGISLSIWTDTGGVGGVEPDNPLILKDRLNGGILDRFNAAISTRV